jgi:hypothetical protein
MPGEFAKLVDGLLVRVIREGGANKLLGDFGKTCGR